MVRAFVSVDVTDAHVLDGVAALQASLNLPNPIPASRLHFTLLFVGQTDRIPEISGALRGVRFRPFDVSLRGIGAFPSVTSPRIIWVGTDPAGARALTTLASAVSDVLVRLTGVDMARFTPHVTIFRVKNRGRHIKECLDIWKEHDFGCMRVSEFRLKQSVLAPEGPTYGDLEVFAAD